MERPEAVPADLWEAYHLHAQLCSGAEDCACHTASAWCVRRTAETGWARLLKKEEKRLEGLETQEAGQRSLARSPAGLENLGNTCYLASYLQMYLRIPPLRRAILSWKEPKGLSGRDSGVANFIHRLQELYAEMLVGSSSVYSPRRVVEALELDNEQQDAGEFGQLLLGLLETAAAGPALRATVQGLFVGRTRGRLSCTAGCARDSRPEEFRELRISLDDAPDIVSGLSALFAEEELGDYRCDCGRVGARREILLDQAPPVLALQLQRFRFDRERERRKKISKALAYPARLDLSSLARSGEALAEDDLAYELVGILVHRGDAATQGHYFSLALDPSLRQWLLLDDEAYQELLPAQLAAITGQVKGTRADLVKHIAKGAYLLVYRRVNLPWATQPISSPQPDDAKDDKASPESSAKAQSNGTPAKVRKTESEDAPTGKTEATLSETGEEIQQRLLSELPESLQDFVAERESENKAEDERKRSEAMEQLETLRERHEDIQLLYRNLRVEADDGPGDIAFLPSRFLKAIQVAALDEATAYLKHLRSPSDEDSTSAEAQVGTSSSHSLPYPAESASRSSPVQSRSPTTTSSRSRRSNGRSEDDLRSASDNLSENFTNGLCVRESSESVLLTNGLGKAESTEAAKESNGAPVAASSDSKTQEDASEAEEPKSAPVTKASSASVVPSASSYSISSETRSLVEGRYGAEELEAALCPHGALPLPTSKTTKWRAVRREAAETLLRQLLDGAGRENLRGLDALCERCLNKEPGEAAERTRVLKDSLKQLAKLVRAQLPTLSKMGERLPGKGPFTRIVCRHVHEQLLAFVKAPAEELRLSLCNQHLLCDHELLRFPMEDMEDLYWPAAGFTKHESGIRLTASPFVVLTEKEWDALLGLPDAAKTAGLQDLVELTDEFGIKLALDGQESQPGLCPECSRPGQPNGSTAPASRLDYKNSQLFMFKVERTEAGVSPGESVANPAQPSGGESSRPQRRSARNAAAAALHPSAFYHDVSSSAMTLKELKVSLAPVLNTLPSDMWLYDGAGRLLGAESGSETLAEAGLGPGDLCRVEVDPPVPEDDDVRRAAKAPTPEKGFQGSLLANH